MNVTIHLLLASQATLCIRGLSLNLFETPANSILYIHSIFHSKTHPKVAFFKRIVHDPVIVMKHIIRE